jgi:hypothetical protein
MLKVKDAACLKVSGNKVGLVLIGKGVAEVLHFANNTLLCNPATHQGLASFL